MRVFPIALSFFPIKILQSLFRERFVGEPANREFVTSINDVRNEVRNAFDLLNAKNNTFLMLDRVECTQYVYAHVFSLKVKVSPYAKYFGVRLKRHVIYFLQSNAVAVHLDLHYPVIIITVYQLFSNYSNNVKSLYFTQFSASKINTQIAKCY